jgi:peptide/nickel transport system substrate-binding protein
MGPTLPEEPDLIRVPRFPVPRFFVALVALVAVLAGCAGQAPGGGAQGSAPGQGRNGAPKKLTAAILDVPGTLSGTINTAGSGSRRGVSELELLVSAGMVILQGDGTLNAELAEAVPTLSNGMWKLFPDGRMETTLKIRNGAQWQDGQPFTSADLAFTAEVSQDKDLALLGHPGYKFLEGYDTPDDRTFVARWKQPYIDADKLFNPEFTIPIPRHILERPYQDDKAAFIQHPYWSTEFIGTGPFKLRTWEGNTYLVLEANDSFVLGRPKIDEIEVRFIPDPNALITNVLAGDVQMSLGRGLSPEQGLQMRNQWQAGRVAMELQNWHALYPQFINPNPPVLANVDMRRGLLHAIDRQQMSEVFLAGLAPVADSFVNPSQPTYKAVESSIVRYPFDVRRAQQLIESLGYTKGADGMYQDASGQKLAVEDRTTAGDDVREKYLLSIADYWKQAGISAETEIIPRQRSNDREYRNTRPAFELVRQPVDLDRFLSVETPLPNNNFTGNNRTRYQSPELDSLIEKYFVTIPENDRTQTLAAIVRHMTDNVVVLGLLYALEPDFISNRVDGVLPVTGDNARATWNAHQWDLKG